MCETDAVWDIPEQISRPGRGLLSPFTKHLSLKNVQTPTVYIIIWVLEYATKYYCMNHSTAGPAFPQ